MLLIDSYIYESGGDRVVITAFMTKKTFLIIFKNKNSLIFLNKICA